MSGWRDQAACKGLTDLFFTERGDIAGQTHPARGVCAACPVQRECLEWAVAQPDGVTRYGLWGGCTAGELRALRRQRRRAS